MGQNDPLGGGFGVGQNHPKKPPILGWFFGVVFGCFGPGRPSALILTGIKGGFGHSRPGAGRARVGKRPIWVENRVFQFFAILEKIEFLKFWNFEIFLPDRV